MDIKIVVQDWSKKSEVVYRYACPGEYSEFKVAHLKALANYQSNQNTRAFLSFLIELMGIPAKIASLLSVEHVFWAEVRSRNGEPELVYIPQFAYLKEPYTAELSIMSRIGLLKGPSNRLNNFSLEQVGYCNHYAKEYAEKNNPSDLNSFIGHAYKLPFISYSPKNKQLSKLYARLIRRGTKEAALQNYSGLQQFYSQLYPRIFTTSQNNGEQSFGLSGTIRRLAQTQIHGSEKECKKTTYPDAMLTFAMLDHDHRETEKKLKKVKI
jgi:hypothetical protein